MENKFLVKQIPIDLIVRGQYQPRSHFNEEKLDELTQSIRNNGLLQPIIVRPIISNKFEIIAGERRWRAAQQAGLTIIDCLVKNYTDRQAAAAAVVENLNRCDLNPIEEAKSYKNLIENFNYSHEEVAATVGKSRASITNSLRLLTLDPEIISMIINNKLTEGHGKILAGVPKTSQVTLAKSCSNFEWSVRKLEKEIKTINNQKNNLVKKDRFDPNLTSLEHFLSEHLGCAVSITFQNGKGQLNIAFTNLDILDGIFKKLGFKPRS